MLNNRGENNKLTELFLPLLNGDKTAIITKKSSTKRGEVMRKKRSIYIFVVLTMSMLIASVALAECPEGKTAITLIAPSGNQKTICV